MYISLPDSCNFIMLTVYLQVQPAAVRLKSLRQRPLVSISSQESLAITQLSLLDKKAAFINDHFIVNVHGTGWAH